jgi:hypothetical protein
VLGIFFALKNPTASAGFEPANLDTREQHASSRPPKPLFRNVTIDIKEIRWTMWIGLTLILLTWRIWRAPNNASKWQIGFNSAFKGLNVDKDGDVSFEQGDERPSCL